LRADFGADLASVQAGEAAMTKITTEHLGAIFLLIAYAG
jgi:hypothetical protein